jgi:hypothetical protein
VVKKLALGHVSYQFFRFPCHFAFNRLLHIHHYHHHSRLEQ